MKSKQSVNPVSRQEAQRSVRPFRFNLQELGGALGDLGTLLPLMIALILVNGLNATSVLVGVGLFYVGSGVYYRIPMPVQPLKGMSAIAISLGLSSSVIGAAGVLMGVILLLLSLTGLINIVVKLFPLAVIKGVQLSIGLILLRKGMEFAFNQQIFLNEVPHFPEMSRLSFGVLLAVTALLIFVLLRFVHLRQSQHFPPSLVTLAFGLAAGVIFNPASGFDKFGPAFPSIGLPNASDFWLALTILVIPQLPLTLGNAVVATSDVAKTYFPEQERPVSPRRLTLSMGVANIMAGLFGAMPMCHGSGGLTAHYKLGARTGGANLMVGGLLLTLGLLFGDRALSFFSLIPLPVLGVLLVIVGLYHTFLIRGLTAKSQLVIAGVVAVTTILTSNLAFGFGAGILLHHLLRLLQKMSTLPTVAKF